MNPASLKKSPNAEDEEKLLDFLAQYEVYRFEESVKLCQNSLASSVFIKIFSRSDGGFGKRISSLGKAEKCTILMFFLHKRQRWAFLFENTLQASVRCLSLNTCI